MGNSLGFSKSSSNSHGFSRASTSSQASSEAAKNFVIRQLRIPEAWRLVKEYTIPEELQDLFIKTYKYHKKKNMMKPGKQIL